MSTLQKQLNHLVRVGMEHYPQTMRAALQTMQQCTTTQEVEKAIALLPAACQPKALRVMRCAEKNGAPVHVMQGYLSNALDSSVVDIRDLPKDVEELGYQGAAEKHGFVYMT